MKQFLRSSIALSIFTLLVSSAQAAPIHYNQETNSDGTVTTTASDNSGAVHDQTREQGKQTKQDLENQGFEVVSKSRSFRLQDPTSYVPIFECDGTIENCPPQKSYQCDPEPTCRKGPLTYQCYDLLVCHPVKITFEE